jgi:hypothetical protein
MQNITSDSDILNTCLEQIERGQATIDSCIRRYPEFKELRELLQVACIMRDLPIPKLNTVSRSAIEQKMLTRFKQTQAVRARQLAASPRTAPGFAQRFAQRPTVRSGGWAMRLASAAFILILFFFTGSAGLVQAAGSSVPGDSLYPVKRSVEQFQLSVADTESLPGVLEQIAEARLTEIKVLSDRGYALESAFVDESITTIHNAVLAQRNFQTRDLLLWQARTTFAYAGERGAIQAEKQTLLVMTLGTLDGQNPGDPSGTTTVVNTDPTGTSTSTLVYTATFTDTPEDTPTNKPTSTRTATVRPTNTPKPRPTQVPTKKPPQPRPTTPGNGNPPSTPPGNTNGGGNGGGNPPSGNGNGNGNGGGNPPAANGSGNGGGKK